MNTILNIIGILLTLGSAIVMLRSFTQWKGILRGGIFLFALGFSCFAFGFIFKIFEIYSNSDLLFFALGAAFMLLGAKKIFTLNPSPNKL